MAKTDPERVPSPVIGQSVVGDIIELPVDYDAYRTFVVLPKGSVEVSDFPETETGTKLVKFRELQIDHRSSRDEVLDRAKQLKLRPPTLAEVDTFMRRFTSEQWLSAPRIGLIGLATSENGWVSQIIVLGLGGDPCLMDNGGPGDNISYRDHDRFVFVCE